MWWSDKKNNVVVCFSSVETAVRMSNTVLVYIFQCKSGTRWPEPPVPAGSSVTTANFVMTNRLI